MGSEEEVARRFDVQIPLCSHDNDSTGRLA